MTIGFDRWLDSQVAQHFTDWDGEECEDCGRALDEDYYETYDGSLLCRSCAFLLASEYIKDAHPDSDDPTAEYEEELDELMEEWHGRF